MAVICSAVHQDVCACVHKFAKPYSANVARYVHENNGLVCQYIGYEFIHKVNRRRAHVSKFIHIYIDFRYAGVSTVHRLVALGMGMHVHVYTRVHMHVRACTCM